MAQMDPRFITDAAAQPNYLATMVGAQEAAQGQINAQRQNALARAYQEQGPGIMAGDPNALNALARYDPAAALGVQSDRQSMEIDQERLSQARSEGARAAAEHGARMDAYTRQQKAEETRAGLIEAGAAWKAGDGAALDAIATRYGFEPGSVTLENFPYVAAHTEGAVEGLLNAQALASPRPDVPASVEALRIRAADAGLQPDTPEYQAFMRDGGRTQESRVIMGPDGRPVYAEGPAAVGMKFTEGQSKDIGYATRMRGSLEVLDAQREDGTRLSDALTSRGDRIAEAVPMGLGREVQSEDFQVAKQAGDEFIVAFLRKDTGAAVTPSEQTTYGDTYLPRPGDGDAVLAAKRDARTRALAAVEAGMNPQQIAAQDRALVDAARKSGDDAGPASAAPYQEPATPDFSTMSDAELQSWIDANQ